MIVKYERDENNCKIIRVTGPSHNYLEFDFGVPDFDQEVIIEARSSGVLEVHGRFSDEFIHEQVKEGIREANEILDQDYKIKRLVYFSTDTYSENIYHFLAFKLVKLFHEDVPSFKN